MIRMPHKEPVSDKPSKGHSDASKETQKFESTVRRMLETPPKPHSQAVKKKSPTAKQPGQSKR